MKYLSKQETENTRFIYELGDVVKGPDRIRAEATDAICDHFNLGSRSPDLQRFNKKELIRIRDSVRQFATIQQLCAQYNIRLKDIPPVKAVVKKARVQEIATAHPIKTNPKYTITTDHSSGYGEYTTNIQTKVENKTGRKTEWWRLGGKTTQHDHGGRTSAHEHNGVMNVGYGREKDGRGFDFDVQHGGDTTGGQLALKRETQKGWSISGYIEGLLHQEKDHSDDDHDKFSYGAGISATYQKPAKPKPTGGPFK